ncbi:acyltransferase [Flavicella sediminum]|uniref:acyltransferase n=1 Tax=Flavicella sediminum TaxID=2585141 RepID=UPI00111DE897|nr:acyltransferase [Flavicella sediminum]
MKIYRFLKNFFFVQLRILKYNYLSTCKKILGKPLVFHPVLCNGYGSISFEKNVQLGVVKSPNFYSHYSYFEAREKEATIVIGKNTAINNNASFIAEKTNIRIGENVLIGVNCHIYDSDFHSIHPQKRTSNSHICKEVIIENNVFIGNNVTLLKGSFIGENSVVAAGSIVSGKFPKNVVLGGNPAKIIKDLDV